MVAATQFAGLVKTAIEEGIDLVVAGAGFQEICSLWAKSLVLQLYQSFRPQN